MFSGLSDCSSGAVATGSKFVPAPVQAQLDVLYFPEVLLILAPPQFGVVETLLQ